MSGRLPLILLVTMISSGCLAEGCQDYPNSEGMLPPDLVDGNLKLISTGSAVVDFDDASSIADARDEATLAAKASIAKFFNETVRSDEALNRAVQGTKTLEGDTKAVTRKEVVERLKRLSSSSQAILRGLVQIGECYTKGREYRVTLGVKPETIAAAESVSGAMSQSLARQPSSSALTQPSRSSQQGQSGQKLDGADSFSRTDLLKKF